MEPIIALNRQRTLYSSTFACLANADSEVVRRHLLLLALESLHRVSVFEFLRRNEWELQELLRHYGRERVGRKRPITQL